MKHLIYFLLFSTVVFSQNYQYAIEESQVKTPDLPTVVNNQLEEIDYFKAYLLPIAQKATLQAALDKYGAVRLEKGDYSGVAIVMKSNQKLYGHPTINNVTSITIAAGSSNVKLQNITATAASGITFQAGAAITNSEFKNIESTPVNSVGGSIENNTFINLSRCVLNWDMSTSGYFRNNKIIKHRIHAYYPQIIMKGNSTTPSYGNVQLWINMLTPGGNGAEIDNLKTLTWVGVDSESWNWYNYSTKPLIEMKNMGDVKIASITGGNLTSTPTPVFDISASSLSISRKKINSNVGNSTLRANTNMFLLDSNAEGYTIDKASTGFDFKGYFNNQNVSLGGVNITGTITDAPTITKLTNTILGSQKTPWAKPVFEPIPDPAGDNWATNRAGKPDQTSYIQNLINTNSIAELEEGIYYISSTLTIKNNQGIIGKGTGKTTIIGLTDDFPLITAMETGPSEVKCYLSNMTLQGGSTGLRIGHSGTGTVQWSACIFKYLVFRNQKYGIHFDKFYGFDNNFIEHVSFVNTNIGVYQEVDPAYAGVGETATMMYIDKVVFYNCQWINNTKALSLLSYRASNLNGWVDCNFDNNGIVAEIKNYNSPFFANCSFTNTKGDYVIGGECETEFYSCVFDKNAVNATFGLYGAYLEGCNVLDNVNLFKTYSAKGFITNSTITGGVGTLNTGMIVNSKMLSAPTFNKILVNVSAAKPIVIIDAAPNPYPQLLVTQ